MFFDSLQAACESKGTSPTALLKRLKMSTSSVTSWKNGVSPSIGTVRRLATALGIEVSVLLNEPSSESHNQTPIPTEQKKEPTLTERDRRDIANDLEQLMEDLEYSDTLMFDGDPLSDEAKESIRNAMQMGLELAKLKNKETYTPKKYKKE